MARTEVSYNQVFQTLEAMWRSPQLPSDVRLQFCGGVQAAARRQGDDVPFREEIMEAVAEHAPLEEEDFLEMVEGVHEYVFVKRGIRLQYLTILLHNMTQNLTRNHQELAQAYQDSVSAEASKN